MIKAVPFQQGVQQADVGVPYLQRDSFDYDQIALEIWQGVMIRILLTSMKSEVCAKRHKVVASVLNWPFLFFNMSSDKLELLFMAHISVAVSKT